MKRVVYRAGQLVIAAVEMYALAECVWYVIAEGESHLYQIAGEKLADFRTRLTYRVQVLDTLRMIRRLPERGE